MKPEFVTLNPPEKHRTYVFPNGKFTIFDVVKINVSPRGTHRLEDSKGQKYIVPPSWIAINFEAEDWTF